MKNKAFAVITCLVLVVAMAIPGTLATSTDTGSSQTNTTAEVPTTSETSVETPTPSEQPAEETPVPSETPKKCTCGAAEGEAHKEGCPLYVAPAEPEKPAESTHIDGCSDECDGTDCECACHKLSLFDRLMACETYEELVEMVDAMTEEELLALTEEQIVQVEEKLLALEPEPLPEIILDENGNVIGEAFADDEPGDEEPFVSEILYPTVNFDHVAPFGEPVVG